MCYVGKATKIFIFLVTVVVVVTGLVWGYGLLRHDINNKAHKCSGDDSCHQSPVMVFPNPCPTTTVNPNPPLPPPPIPPYPPFPYPDSTPTLQPPVVVSAAPPTPVVTPGPVQPQMP